MVDARTNVGDQPSPRVGKALFRSFLRPIQAFFRLEAASGLVLLGCAALALVWANASQGSYRLVFDAPLGVRIGSLSVEFSLLELVNDGLMAVFFFVVGMEIKRELVLGELRSIPQAMLPAIAALGGMLVPAVIFLGFNAGGPGASGWGIPMATDIAFCIGVLTLLKTRVPHGLIVFITALAIFDDIGGILVIALFYGTGIHLLWLAAAAAVTVCLVAMCRTQVRSGIAWTVGGVLLWYTLHHAGIHATIAGVVLGLAIPARARRSPHDVLAELSTYAEALSGTPGDEERDSAAIESIEEHLEDVQAPLTRFVDALHPWVAFGIMPLFALGNSGVHIGGIEPAQMVGPVALGTALALFLGKQAGIFLFTIAGVRLGWARLPTGASVPKLFGASIVAGIGFTVALFIAGLAYPRAPALLDEAKLGILVGSLISGIVGALLLLSTRPVAPTVTGDANTSP